MKDRLKPNKPKKPVETPKRNPKKAPIGKFYGGSDGWRGVRTRPAKQLVNSAIRKEVNPLKDELRQNQTNYDREQSGIGNIYNSTDQYITGKNAETMAAYDQAASSNSLAQQALQKQLLGSGAQAAANVSSELSRLGITDPNALNSVVSNSQGALNIAAQTAANNEANLSAQRAGAVSIGNLLLGSTMGARNQALGESRNDYRDAQSEISDAIRDARGARSDLLLQMLEQMRQSAWGQHMDQENLNLQKAQFAWQKQQAKLAARASGGVGGGGGGGSSSSAYGGGGSSPTGDGPAPMKPNKYGYANPNVSNPDTWFPGVGVLSNEVPPAPSKPKPEGWGRGLGVKVKPKKNPRHPAPVDPSSFIYGG